MKCHWYLECTQKGTAKSSRKGNYGYLDAMEPVVNECQLHKWIVYTPTSNSIAKRNAYQRAIAWEHAEFLSRHQFLGARHSRIWLMPGTINAGIIDTRSCKHANARCNSFPTLCSKKPHACQTVELHCHRHPRLSPSPSDAYHNIRHLLQSLLAVGLQQ